VSIDVGFLKSLRSDFKGLFIFEKRGEKVAKRKSSRRLDNAIRKVERKSLLVEFLEKDTKEGYSKEKARRDLLWLKQKATLAIEQDGANAKNFSSFLLAVKGLVELDDLLNDVSDERVNIVINNPWEADDENENH
jgi:hypothetical protein